MQTKPEKLWLIIGQRPTAKTREVKYSTDPRDYPLPDQKPMTDSEYAELSSRLRVFVKAADAVDFCYDCGLETTRCIGFRLVDGKYQQDLDVANEVLDFDW